MALAHKLCLDNVEGCRQRMQRALAPGRMQSSQVCERLQHTIQEKQQARLKDLHFILTIPVS